MKKLREMSWLLPIGAALTLGLAPFVPVPHVVEKLGMLFSGRLSAPIDIFDLAMHGFPWVVLVAKIVVSVLPNRDGESDA